MTTLVVYGHPQGRVEPSVTAGSATFSLAVHEPTICLEGRSSPSRNAGGSAKRAASVSAAASVTRRSLLIVAGAPRTPPGEECRRERSPGQGEADPGHSPRLPTGSLGSEAGARLDLSLPWAGFADHLRRVGFSWPARTSQAALLAGPERSRPKQCGCHANARTRVCCNYLEFIAFAFIAGE